MKGKYLTRRAFLQMGALAGASLLAAACQQAPSPTSTPEPSAPEATAVPPTAIPEPTAEPANIVIWSHFATEPAKQKSLNHVFNGYAEQHDNVTVDVNYWDKAAMFDAYRAAMTAGGVGAPDIVYFDDSQMDWIEAGWLLEIGDLWDPDDFVAGLDQSPLWNYCIQYEGGLDIILYNREIFAELGIEVPDNLQFSQDEFTEVVRTLKAGGYSPLADAIGDREYFGQYVPRYALLSLVGSEEYGEYIAGQRSWDTPDARSVLEWNAELCQLGLYPPSFSTMGVDEVHLYFHTQRKAGMLFIGSWYTGRAFKEQDAGGQDPDWHPGMLRYPAMNGGRGHDLVAGGFGGGGFSVCPTGKNVEISRDILRTWAKTPKYAAIHSAYTYAPSAIKFAPEDLPDEVKNDPEIGKYAWWSAEMSKVYGDCGFVQEASPCGDFHAARVAELNEALPLGLHTVDEVIAALDAALCS